MAVSASGMWTHLCRGLGGISNMYKGMAKDKVEPSKYGVEETCDRVRDILYSMDVTSGKDVDQFWKYFNRCFPDKFPSGWRLQCLPPRESLGSEQSKELLDTIVKVAEQAE